MYTPLSGIRVKNARSAPVGLVLDADAATHAIEQDGKKRSACRPCHVASSSLGGRKGDQKATGRELTERSEVLIWRDFLLKNDKF